MNRVNYEMPVATAVEMLSLGMDMKKIGVASVPCHVPCIENDGVLVPMLEAERGAYPSYPFSIAVEGDEDIGGGLMSLTPQPIGTLLAPRVGAPVFLPEIAPEDIVAEASRRTGYAALRSSFLVETVLSPNDAGRDRVVGTTAMLGVQADGSEKTLQLGERATGFYMGVIKDVGASKVDELREQL